MNAFMGVFFGFKYFSELTVNYENYNTVLLKNETPKTMSFFFSPLKSHECVIF
jgi:hypothetical protein